MKNKIEELKKEIEKLVRNFASTYNYNNLKRAEEIIEVTIERWSHPYKILKAKLQAYEEAQKEFQEKIDELMSDLKKMGFEEDDLKVIGHRIDKIFGGENENRK